MKIRIEGCTAEELAEHSRYLSLGKVYEGQPMGFDMYTLRDDDGQDIQVLVCPDITSCHLPEGAKWVEVTDQKDDNDALISELYENDYKDGWCGHDVSAEALLRIIERVRAYPQKKAPL